MQHNFTLNLRKQDKTANKKSPAIVRGRGITNKIFNDGKITTKIILLQANFKKSARPATQVIDGYLCYNKRRYNELNYEQKEQYNDCFISQADKEAFEKLLRETQLKYVL